MLKQLSATADALGVSNVTTVATEAETLPLRRTRAAISSSATPSSITSPTSTAPSPNSAACCSPAA